MSNDSPPACFDCAHFSDAKVKPTNEVSGFTCKAYPGGIPRRILYGIHVTVQKDQAGEYVYSNENIPPSEVAE